MKSARTNLLLKNIFLVLLIVISLLPILMVVINGFKPHVEIVKSPIAFPQTIKFDNFIEAWEVGKLGRGFWNSIKLTGITIIIVTICSSLAGYVLSGPKFRGQRAILVYFMMATTVPMQIFMFPLYFVVAKLELVGVIPVVSVILSATSMPLAVFLMRTYFLAVPRELEEAAVIDGASTWQVIWYIMRPIVSPGMITVATIVGLQTWNEYLISSTFLQGEKSFTATLGFLSMNGTYSSDQGVLMAAAVIMIVPIVIFFIAIQKYFIEGIASGAVKG